MAFMHKNTFEIIQHSEIRGYLKDYFEVDDIIALTLQALNRKGYYTAFSCAGHPFEETDCASCRPKEPIKKEQAFDMIDGTYKVKKNKNGEYRIFFKIMPRESYILFQEDIVFPFLPKGFDCHGGRLSISYDEKIDVFSFYDAQLAAMKELYKWAELLPIINS